MISEQSPFPASALSPRSILLIEDSITIRSFLKHIFEREMPDARIVEASDGREALHEMTREKIDLIVTDLQMPGMDGRSFIAKLRSNALLRKKCVLVLSGDEVGDLQELYKDDPGIRFLQKPSAAPEIVQAARALAASTLNARHS